MTRSPIVVSIALVLTACAEQPLRTAQHGAIDHQQDAGARAEQRLVRNYTAQPATSCIALSEVRSRRIVSADAIFFELNGGLMYRAEPVGSCSQMMPNAYARILPAARAQVEAPRRLCSGDRIEVSNDTSPLRSVCTVGPFTPYQRQGRDRFQ